MSKNESTKKELDALVGKKVTISVSTAGYARKGFWPQMSIVGTLEQHPEESNAFRIVK